MARYWIYVSWKFIVMCIQNAIKNLATMDKFRNTRLKFDGDFSLG